MMPRRRLLSLALLLFALPAFFACKRHHRLSHQFNTFELGYQGCHAGEENCTYLKLSYPTFRRAPTREGLQAINHEILAFILAPTGEKQADDVEGFAKQFFSDYDSARQQFPQAPQVWTLERSVDIMVEEPQLLSLAMDQNRDMGGAHPNATSTLLSLDPATGKRYGLGDLLKPGFEAPLNALGEKAFRTARKIPEGQSLEDAGFRFEGGAFKLNDNFAAAANGLVFYYNSYEVGPYALGPTEVVIDYASLSDWIKRDGPLEGISK